MSNQSTGVVCESCGAAPHHVGDGEMHLTGLAQVFDRAVTEKRSRSVVCVDCKKEHDATADTFITVYGNITVGSRGGVVGNNFGFLAGEPRKMDPENSTRLDRVTIFCVECFAKFASDLVPVGKVKEDDDSRSSLPSAYEGCFPRRYGVHVNGTTVWCLGYEITSDSDGLESRAVIEGPRPWEDLQKLKGTQVEFSVPRGIGFRGTITEISPRRMVIESKFRVLVRGVWVDL